MKYLTDQSTRGCSKRSDDHFLFIFLFFIDGRRNSF
jgi:hypothetical protein